MKLAANSLHYKTSISFSFESNSVLQCTMYHGTAVAAEAQHFQLPNIVASIFLSYRVCVCQSVCVCVEGLWTGINSNIENLSSLANAVGQITVRCFMNVCVVVYTVRTSSIVCVCVLCSLLRSFRLFPQTSHCNLAFFHSLSLRKMPFVHFATRSNWQNDQCHTSNLFKRIRSATTHRDTDANMRRKCSVCKLSIFEHSLAEHISVGPILYGNCV